jgi:hypothetical protein
MDACKQDCFFDGDSGMGNDGCDWDLRCDPANPGASSAKSCEYNPQFNNCKKTQSETCIKNCRRVTPNGCDCFGCCAVTVGGTTRTVLLVSTCKAELFADTKACPACTQQTSCLNECGKCEICVGKPAPDPSCTIVTTPPPADGGTGGTGGTPDGGTPPTPPDAGEQPCPPGVTYCGPGGAACGSGSYCLTGCCVIP